MDTALTEPDPFVVESAGVDWLTATAYRTQEGERFREHSRDLIAQSASHGNDVRPWRAGGYHGQQSAGIIYGVRHDTHILKLSSDDARESWRESVSLASNVSRLDVQITLRLKVADVLFIARQRENAMRARGVRGRRSNVTLIQSTTDGDSLYLGKRSSDVYARCYDKGREQKSDPSGILIRQELEFKGSRAVEISARLATTTSEAIESATIVSSYMRSREIQTLASVNSFRLGARGRVSSNDVRLRWLSAAVRPSVRLLLAGNRLTDVLEALGLAEHVTINKTEADK